MESNPNGESKMRWSLFVFIVQLSFLGCAVEPVPKEIYRLSNVEPAVCDNDVSNDLTISGERFNIAVSRRLDCGGAFEVNDQFSGSLDHQTAESTQVVLESTLWVDTQTLTATVPSGMVFGVYSLTITDPYGRTVTLLNALEVTETTECVDGDGCDDGLFCNGTDTCVGSVCTHQGDPCVSGPECADVCDETSDTCDLPPGTACTDDGDICTDDECDGLGVCVHPDNAASCDDGLFCNGTDTCAGGVCTHSGDPCSSGPECADTCDESFDTCNLPSGDACADDGNPCTDDECDGLGVCVHPDNAASCDDGLFCTVVDACVGGVCTGSGDMCPGQVCNETTDTCEDFVVVDDPLGDSSSFAFVFSYSGQVWVGPRSDGTGVVHMSPTGGTITGSDFSFLRDFTGNVHQNTSTDPYPSIGWTGCTPNTSECGPDNEDGRGLFWSGVMGGYEWLIAAGARLGGDMNYVYMTQDTGSVLEFFYMDLSVLLGSQTFGISSAHVFSDRLYLGFPDDSGSRPYFISVLTTPTTPGLDAVGNGGSTCDPLLHDSCDLRAKDMPGIGKSSANSIIDVIWDFNNRLYIANNGGIVRSTVDQPLGYSSFPGHWEFVTPTNTDYSSLTSITTSKTSDLEPADKAVPSMASFGGKLFFARNTDDGPQLWSCMPGVVSGPLPATASDCDPGDWQLIAPNTVGDVLLSQFNNANNTHISALVASPTHLYVAFDNMVDGVVLFRTNSSSALSAADFEGEGGCAANLHPSSCEGLWANGFGDALNSRVFSSIVFSDGGDDYLYVVVGDGTDAVKLFIFVA